MSLPGSPANWESWTPSWLPAPHVSLCVPIKQLGQAVPALSRMRIPPVPRLSSVPWHTLFPAEGSISRCRAPLLWYGALECWLVSGQGACTGTNCCIGMGFLHPCPPLHPREVSHPVAGWLLRAAVLLWMVASAMVRMLYLTWDTWEQGKGATSPPYQDLPGMTRGGV